MGGERPLRPVSGAFLKMLGLLKNVLPNLRGGVGLCSFGATIAAAVSSPKRAQCIAVAVQVFRAIAGNMGQARGCVYIPAWQGVLPCSPHLPAGQQCLCAKFCFQAYLQKYPNKLFLIDAM